MGGADETVGWEHTQLWATEGYALRNGRGIQGFRLRGGRGIQDCRLGAFKAIRWGVGAYEAMAYEAHPRDLHAHAPSLQPLPDRALWLSAAHAHARVHTHARERTDAAHTATRVCTACAQRVHSESLQ
eukprot:447476-Rhodomonas_salina.2